MSSEKLMKNKEVALAYNAGMTLKKLGEALCARKMPVGGEGSPTIPVSPEVNIEYKLKRKSKEGKADKFKLEFEISWTAE